MTNMTSAAFAEITKFFSPLSSKVLLSIGVAAVTKFSSLHIGLFSVTAKAAMISPDAICDKYCSFVSSLAEERLIADPAQITEPKKGPQ